MGYEITGFEILQRLGYEKVRRPQHRTKYMSYDFDAEKDGVKYSVEIKTTADKVGRYTIPVNELREMAWQLIDNKRKALLLFVDESQTPVNYYLFEMKRTIYGLFACDGEGKIISMKEA